MEFLKGNLWEIKRSASLRIFGLLMALGHVLVFTYWSLNGKLPVALASSSTPMCWPVLDGCEFVHFLSLPLLNFLFGSYLAFAILTGLLVLSTRIVGAAWFFMLVTTVIEAVLYFQDYRLSLNVIYLHLLGSFIWLLFPNKIRSLKYLTLSYFLASGLIMLSPEWLIGTWYMESIELPKKLAEWFAALGTMITFIGPLALFFKDLRYFFVSLLTLLAYLASSIYVGNFLEPSLLIFFILLFVFDLFEERKMEREFIYQSFIRPEPSKVWPWLLVTLFWVAQAVPFMPVKMPKYIENYSKLYALTPIPPHRECIQKGYFIFEDKISTIDPELFKRTDTAKSCNSYIRFLQLKDMCAEMKDKEGFVTIEGYLYIRGLKDKSFKAEFENTDICNPGTSFNKARQG